MEEVYCTMLLTDSYLPGAQVLAHSLRDGGATRKLAVLATVDHLSEGTIEELNVLYDYVIPVERITSASYGNLQLMGRPDLSSAFTKINLWRLVQFSKIVYIDADVVAVRAPEELFDVNEPFAACPDIGWPDCFNSGVMVLTPDLATFRNLRNLAQRSVSFDGADQGLLNQYFREWHRLSFVYNVTPSGHYQYVPAYQHYKSNITMAHFIGAGKPWTLGRSGAKSPSTPYGEMLAKWWAVWDAHYGPLAGLGPGPQGEKPNQMPTEYDPNFRRSHVSYDRGGKPAVWHPPNPRREDRKNEKYGEGNAPPPVFLPKEYLPYISRDIPPELYSRIRIYSHEENPPQSPEQLPKYEEKQPVIETPMQPPVNTRPGAQNLPSQLYQNRLDGKQDTALFVPPPPASPPKYHQLESPPKERVAPRATRVFADSEEASSEGSASGSSGESSPVSGEYKIESSGGYHGHNNSRAAWDSYPRSNAWDNIPGIDRYVAAFERSTKPRKKPSASRKGDVTPVPRFHGGQAASPSAVTLPSPKMSVTPTPFNSTRGYRSSAIEDEKKYPSAKGVPNQLNWDPFRSLEELKNAPVKLLNKRSLSIMVN
ncbi:glycogenin glucosyltransferase [Orbilia ellipsospora]|uniref:glycogenin glucosyltransferase n=1 Tax=Orbilia ellipsospora TaxID=2528407 RepID=A0AAV9WVU0_9PEZI